MDDLHDLNRFVLAQEHDYEQALSEIVAASPPFYGCGFFTKVTVTADGYSAEWCTLLCATTPFASS